MSSPTARLGPPRGMRDFYPETMALRTLLFDAWRNAATRFGFVQYDACVVESLDLLKRKAGEEIVDQIYWFKDKSGRELALRPEMTPTLARMVAARQGSLSLPVKWYAIAQCFRYERMTKGRKREHYQWNLDVLGEESPTAEAEVVAGAVDALTQLGLCSADFAVFFSSRALLADLLARLGIPEQHHAATFLALDKRGKVPDEEIRSLLAGAGLKAKDMGPVLELLQVADLDQAVSMLGEETRAVRDIRFFLTQIEAYGISDSVVFDTSVIRGLAYYTGIVFEAFDRDRESRAIFGGGRYDNLAADIGGKPLTGVGLGFGDVVISDLLAAKGKLPDKLLRVDVSVGYMQEAQRCTAVRVARLLREQGKSVDLAMHPEKAKSFFSRVGKGNCHEAAYVGPDDVESGVVRVKNLATREERQLAL